MLRKIHRLGDETNKQFLKSVSPLSSCVVLVLLLIFFENFSYLFHKMETLTFSQATVVKVKCDRVPDLKESPSSSQLAFFIGLISMAAPQGQAFL